jgi:hypothetical protein
MDAVKTKAEREAEEAARLRQRVQEALASAETALSAAIEALKFAHDKIRDKQQAAKLENTEGGAKLTVTFKPSAPETGEAGKPATPQSLSIALDLDRTTAVLRVSFLEGKPREFDFARDRHIAPADVEEYVGRRAVELVRNAQKASPW